MSRLVESIRISGGRFWNLDLHEARANHSLKTVFGISRPLDLSTALHGIIPAGRGTYKCRVLYRDTVEEITVTPYRVRPIQTAMTVVSNDIEYTHKYEDRPGLDRLYAMRGVCDEIIVIKNGLVTDAFYYNLLFEKDGHLFTPATPLLKGVQRELLLIKGKVTLRDIRMEEISDYDKIHFVNALTLPGKAVITPRDIFHNNSLPC